MSTGVYPRATNYYYVVYVLPPLLLSLSRPRPLSPSLSLALAPAFSLFSIFPHLLFHHSPHILRLIWSTEQIPPESQTGLLIRKERKKKHKGKKFTKHGRVL